MSGPSLSLSLSLSLLSLSLSLSLPLSLSLITSFSASLCSSLLYPSMTVFEWTYSTLSLHIYIYIYITLRPVTRYHKCLRSQLRDVFKSAPRDLTKKLIWWRINRNLHYIFLNLILFNCLGDFLDPSFFPLWNVLKDDLIEDEHLINYLLIRLWI